jgi:hypothetical protein
VGRRVATLGREEPERGRSPEASPAHGEVVAIIDSMCRVVLSLLFAIPRFYKFRSGPRRFLGDGQDDLGIGGRNGVPLTHVQRPIGYERWARLLAAPTNHAGKEGSLRLVVASEI